MNEQDFLNMIYAYATGSLDAEDTAEFLILKKSGGLKLAELGELQNVISLLPVILEIEKPNSKLKDKVARRLYKMQSEILAKANVDKRIIIPAPVPHKNKITREDSVERQNNFYDEPLHKEVTKPFIDKEEIDHYKSDKIEPYTNEYIEQGEPLLNEELFKELKDQESGGDKSLYVQKPNIPPSSFTEHSSVSNNYPQFLAEEEEFKPKAKASKLVTALIILIVLLIAIVAAGIYFYFNGQLNESNIRISSLNQQIKSMDNEITRLNKSQRVLSILNSKDAKTINLDGTISNPTGFGKLILDTGSGEALLQLYHMPSLKNHQVYHLWIISKGQVISLGNYKPKKEVEYLPVSEVPEILIQDIDSVKVTVEENEGSEAPQGDVFLQTTIKPSSLK